MRRTSSDGLDLTGARLRVLSIARVLLAIFTAVVLIPLIPSDVLDEHIGTVAATTTGYVALNLLVLLAMRAGRAPRLLLNITLVIDAAILSGLMFATGGNLSPLTFIMYVYVIGATVLFSWQNGVKLGLLFTIGLLLIAFNTAADVASGEDSVVIGLFEVPAGSNVGILALEGGTRLTIVFQLVALWVIAGSSAYFSWVNEQALRQSNQELAVLREVSNDIEHNLDRGDISEAVARGVVNELGYDRAVVWLAEGSELGAAGAAGFSPEDLAILRGLRLGTSSGPVGDAVGTHSPVLVARDDPRPAVLADAFEVDSPLVIVPFWSENRLLGLLVAEVDAPLGRAPRVTGRDVRILSSVASEASLALDNARLHDELRDLATTDALTGVYNHRYFQQRLQEELDRGLRRGADGISSPVSLVLFDIDYFKKVNDRFGHPSGDELLRALARLTRRVLRSSDVICRYGGEEFGIILPDTSLAEAAAVAERLREAIQLSNFIGSESRYLGQITASFGVATYEEGLPSRSDLINRADEALYVAKDAGRNRVVSSESKVTSDVDLEPSPVEVAPAGER